MARGEMPYTVSEVAALVKVHPNTIRREIKKGRLQAWRPDNKNLRIEPDAIEAWKLRKGAVSPPKGVGSKGLRALEGGAK